MTIEQIRKNINRTVRSQGNGSLLECSVTFRSKTLVDLREMNLRRHEKEWLDYTWGNLEEHLLRSIYEDRRKALYASVEQLVFAASPWSVPSASEAARLLINEAKYQPPQ